MSGLYCCIVCGYKVIHAGEKLRESKKKQKMASSNSTTNRDWGKVSEYFGWNEAKQFMSDQEEDIAKDLTIRLCVVLLAFQIFKLIVKTTVALLVKALG